VTVAGQHGQPVALPPAVGSQRVEADRPADLVVGQADHVDRGRVVVVPVKVGAVPVGAVPVAAYAASAAHAASAAEQSLLGHEDLAPDLEVGVPFGAGGYGPAG